MSSVSQKEISVEINIAKMRTIVFPFMQILIVAAGQNPSGLILFNNMMKFLFENCGQNFGTVGFYGKNIFFESYKTDVVLLDDDTLFNATAVRKIKFLVAYIDADNFLPEITAYIEDSVLKIETMFVFDGDNSSNSMYSVFEYFQSNFDTSKVYYCTAQDKLDVVSLNAFGDVAPEFWVKIDDIYYNYNNWNFHWRIFKTQYPNDKIINSPELCKKFIFDRTEDLSGHIVRAFYQPVSRSRPATAPVITKHTDPIEIAALIDPEIGNRSLWLMEFLNISIKMFPLGGNTDMTLFDVCNNLVDFILTEMEGGGVAPKTTYTSSVRFFHLVIVSHNRGLMTPLEKMFEFYGWLTIFATAILLSITFLVIYRSNNRKIFFAVSECIRLLIGTGIKTRMNSNAIRIFFSVIFLYFLVIQATFSGHLASFLTKPQYRLGADTMKDLEDPFYSKIIISRFNNRHLMEEFPLLNNKIKPSCCHIYIDYIENGTDRSIAYIGFEEDLKPSILKYNMHRSLDTLRNDFSFLVMRYNWALQERLNKFVMRLRECFILDRWEENKNRWMRTIEIKNLPENYRPVQVNDLKFAFVFLARGLGCAIIVSVVELLLAVVIKVLKKRLLREINLLKTLLYI